MTGLPFCVIVDGILIHMHLKNPMIFLESRDLIPYVDAFHFDTGIPISNILKCLSDLYNKCVRDMRQE